jgi:hypothetical protein
MVDDKSIRWRTSPGPDDPKHILPIGEIEVYGHIHGHPNAGTNPLKFSPEYFMGTRGDEKIMKLFPNYDFYLVPPNGQLILRGQNGNDFEPSWENGTVDDRNDGTDKTLVESGLPRAKQYNIGENKWIINYSWFRGSNHNLKPFTIDPNDPIRPKATPGSIDRTGATNNSVDRLPRHPGDYVGPQPWLKPFSSKTLN